MNVSNETLETVSSQAEEADANVQRSEDLLTVFKSTLTMVKFMETKKMIQQICPYDLNGLIIVISDSQLSANANVERIEIETIYDHTHSSLFHGIL